MRSKKVFLATARMVFVIAILAVAFKAYPQGGITVYQYRQVQPDKVDEFVKRETTYWSEVAKKAVTKGNLYGQRFEIRAPLATPSGRRIVFQSVWQIDKGADLPRLITLYPR